MLHAAVASQCLDSTELLNEGVGLLSLGEKKPKPLRRFMSPAPSAVDWDLAATELRRGLGPLSNALRVGTWGMVWRTLMWSGR